MADMIMEYIKSVGADREPDMKPGDYRNEQGLIVCGKCGIPRQKKLNLPFGGGETIVHCTCLCEQEDMRKKAEQEKKREEMFRIRELKNTSLMDSKYDDAKFCNYEQDADNSKAFKVAQNYVANFDKMFSDNQGLIFHGPVGTGKTYTAACIANALLDKEISVIMTSFVKILQEIQNTGVDEGVYLQKLNTARLLIIDDLGVERNTDYALEKTYNVIDSRARSKKPFILTTNLTWDELTKEQDLRYKRIFDRILEVCYPVHVPGKSHRIKKAAQRMNDTRKILEG